MLKPDKFTELNRSLIYAVAILIKILKENNYKYNYSDLYYSLESHISDDALYLFLPAVDFLFLVGRIEYDMKSDIMEMII